MRQQHWAAATRLRPRCLQSGNPGKTVPAMWMEGQRCLGPTLGPKPARSTAECSGRRRCHPQADAIVETFSPFQKPCGKRHDQDTAYYHSRINVYTPLVKKTDDLSDQAQNRTYAKYVELIAAKQCQKFEQPRFKL